MQYFKRNATKMADELAGLPSKHFTLAAHCFKRQHHRVEYSDISNLRVVSYVLMIKEFQATSYRDLKNSLAGHLEASSFTYVENRVCNIFTTFPERSLVVCPAPLPFAGFCQSSILSLSTCLIKGIEYQRC